MYRSELIRRISKKTRFSQASIAVIMRTSNQIIEEALSKGERVQLPGFGTFYTRERAKSKARHFATGAALDVPAMRVAAFRAGALLKRAARDGRGKKAK